MGSRYDNGGTPPPEGGGSADGLPGLPPEWGTVVVPDDASALAGEADLVRREMRRRRRHDRLVRLVPGSRADTDPPPMAIPLIIMAVAVLATLSSLLVVAWPSPLVRRTPPVGVEAHPSAVPDVRFTDSMGAVVQLRDSLPAVVLLVDGCACTELVHAAATAAPPAVSVLVVGRTVPEVASADAARALPLADRQAALATLFAGWPAPAGMATVLLIRGDGSVAKVVSGDVSTQISPQDFLPGLRGLT